MDTKTVLLPCLSVDDLTTQKDNLDMFGLNSSVGSKSTIQLNVNHEDNDYFLDLIRKFNLNKDHYIVKINRELDEFLYDSYGTTDYVESKFTEIVDYISNHPEENVLGLILIDRILWMLPKFNEYMDRSLRDLPSRINPNMTLCDLDDIARRVNTQVAFAKKIKCIRETVSQYKQKLVNQVGYFRTNHDYNPFLLREGHELFY